MKIDEYYRLVYMEHNNWLLECSKDGITSNETYSTSIQAIESYITKNKLSGIPISTKALKLKESLIAILNTDFKLSNMKQLEFTREEVIALISKLLEDPDVILDAVQNDGTIWDAETLLEKVEN